MGLLRQWTTRHRRWERRGHPTSAVCPVCELEFNPREDGAVLFKEDGRSEWSFIHPECGADSIEIARGWLRPFKRLMF